MVRVTANAMTSRPTNVTKTNQCPAFVAYHRKEVCMHPHAEKRAHPPSSPYCDALTCPYAPMTASVVLFFFGFWFVMPEHS